MSLLLLLAAETATPAPPPPEIADQIVVIARKMKAWKGSLQKRDGKIVCRTTRSTKDAEIDAIRCGAMIACTTPIDAELTRIGNDTAVPVAERRKRFNVLLQTTVPCMEQHNDDATRALAEKRVRA